jgi:hypothetical protein
VVTPSGRGPDGFYMGYTEADVFETWADAARHYPVDPTWVAPTGYSMGGFGTYRLMARYPDLFGRGFSVVGIPGTVGDQLASLRGTPLLAWNGAADELVNVRRPSRRTPGWSRRACRTSTTCSSPPTTSPWRQRRVRAGAAFLGEARADRSPPQVSYVVDPREDNAEAGVVADSAYWLSGLRVRDAAAGHRHRGGAVAGVRHRAGGSAAGGAGRGHPARTAASGRCRSPSGGSTGPPPRRRTGRPPGAAGQQPRPRRRRPGAGPAHLRRRGRGGVRRAGRGRAGRLRPHRLRPADRRAGRRAAGDRHGVDVGRRHRRQRPRAAGHRRLGAAAAARAAAGRRGRALRR